MTGIFMVKGEDRDTNRTVDGVEVEPGIGVMGRVTIIYQHLRKRCGTVSSPEPPETNPADILISNLCLLEW